MAVSDRDLIDGFLKGDRQSHQTIAGWVSVVIRSGSWNPSLSPEDIAADTLEKLFINLKEGQFRSDSSLKTYVQKIAKFTMIDAGRRSRRVQSDSQEILDAAADPDDFLTTFVKREEYALYLRMFDLIGNECKALWKLLFQEELPHAEIGKTLGISTSAVKTRAFRCKERAKEIIQRIS